MASGHNDSDARFEALLEDYHEALARGGEEAFFATEELSAELRARLEGAAACMRQLHAVWHVDNDATMGIRDDLTPAPLNGLWAPGRLDRIGRFHIERELGRGGNGVVLVGVDPQLQRRVAVKVPFPEVLVHAELRQRFLREAEIAARLRHPNLLAVYESGEHGPICYIASEYCAGPNLAQWLRERRSSHPPSMDEIVDLMICLADAVQHAHARGVLHRDLKPSNVLLEPGERAASAANPRELPLSAYAPKVADFGLAKLVEQGSDQTRTGMLLGTLLYMSPEQAEGRVRDISVQSDVYALGAILYELLTGQPPFCGDNDRSTLHQILMSEPARPSQAARGVPRDLEAICLKCLQKRPAARYATAGELAGDLRRHRSGLPTVARPPSALESVAVWVRRRPLVAGLAALLIGALVTIVAGTAVYNGRLSRTVDELRSQREIAQAREREAREYAYSADMMLAQQAWDRSAPEEARALLSRWIPKGDEEDIRGYEWYSLWRRMADTSIVVARQDSKVWSLAASRDGSLVATGDDRGVIRLWDRERCALLKELHGHEQGFIDRIVFTHDGKWLISAGDDHTIRWWDVETGENALTWREHSDWVGALALSRHGDWLVSGGGDGRVLLWNVRTRSLERELYRHAGAVRWVVFNHKNEWIVSACEVNEVRIWDFEQNRPPDQFPEGRLPMPEESTKFRWNHAVFHWDAKTLYASARDRIYVWDLRDDVPADERARVLPCVEEDAYSLEVAGYPGLLIEGGGGRPTISSRRLGQWDAAVHTLRGHSDAIRCLLALPDDATVLSGSEDGTVRQWNIAITDPQGQHLRMPDRPVRLAWAPDSRRLWVVLVDGRACTIDDLERPTTETVPHLADIHCVLPCQGSTIAIDSLGTVYRSMDDAASAVRENFASAGFAIPADATAVAADATGGRLAFAAQQDVELWAVGDGQVRWRKQFPQPVDHVLLLPDGSVIATCGDEGIYRLAADDGSMLARTSRLRDAVKSVDLSDDGRTLAVAYEDSVRILSASTLADRQAFVRSGLLHAAWFINRDQRLLVNSDERLVTMNPRTGQDLLIVDNKAVAQAEVSPDGQWLAIMRYDRDIALVRLEAD